MKDENQDVTNPKVRTTETGFPVNQVTFSGIVIGEKLLKDGNALSFGISQPKDDSSTGVVINVYVNGKTNVEMFQEQIKNFKNNNFKKTGSDQLLSPLVMVKGLSNFSTYKNEAGVENSTVTIIANDWKIPQNEKELIDFRKTYNGNNPEQNEISIVGVLGKDVEISNKDGKEYARLSVAHNYKIGTKEDPQTKTMWMNVYVPTKVIPELKNLNLEKGSSINLRGKLSPSTFTTEKGKSQRISINATSITSNMKNVIAQAKTTEKVKEFAQEAIGNVANIKNGKERIEKSENLKSDIDKKFPKLS